MLSIWIVLNDGTVYRIKHADNYETIGPSIWWKQEYRVYQMMRDVTMARFKARDVKWIGRKKPKNIKEYKLYPVNSQGWVELGNELP